MKKEYEKLKEKCETFNISQIEQAVDEFVENLFESYYIQSIDIDKVWCTVFGKAKHLLMIIHSAKNFRI